MARRFDMCRVRFVCIGLLAVLVLAGISYPAVAASTEEASAQKSVVIIEASKTGEPVSKYIYGQFIEHLGRCIYGGIWAEMLEDRKFWHPIPVEGPVWKEHKGARVLIASPWRVVGDKDAVKMSTESPFVGEHTPEIKLPGDGTPCGIFQDDLALRKGREYVGRVVLAADSESVVARVSLYWNLGNKSMFIENLSDEFTTTQFSFTVGGDTDDGQLEIVGRGKGTLRIGTVSLMPMPPSTVGRAETL
jgi:alpha-N-arabinofuranosidase